MTGNLFPARLRTTHQEKRQNNNYRRNGKLQACEPCRKGKLRCDHMMPTCARCTRLKKPEKCVYHPAPLTKNTSTTIRYATASTPTSPSTASFSTLYSSRADHDDSQAISNFNGHITPGAEVPSSTALDLKTKRRNARTDKMSAKILPCNEQYHEELHKPLPDYQTRADSFSLDNRSGITSNSAILAENEINVGILNSNVDLYQNPQVSQVHIERGAAVLTLLKDMPTIEKYIDKWFSFAGGIVVIEPMVKIYVDGIWSTWQRTLKDQKPNDLRLMSEKIWRNTLRPVSNLLKRHTTPREFCLNVTGESLRWEIVGIIVSLVSLLAQSLTDGDPVFCLYDEAPVDRFALALKMHNASEMCVNFCDDIGTLNDLYLWLLYENSIAYCSMRTKGIYENAQKTSRLTTALLSCNLHQEIKVDDNTPFFMAELRKRLFICVYENDKNTSVSAGRPPRLTRQYCQLQIPLDLTDAQTMSDGSNLERAVRELDEDGWNQNGVVQKCTFARLSAQNALITEEILEISLGNLPRDEIRERAADIRLKTQDCWEALPEFLRIDINDTWTSKRSPLEILALLSIRLNHLNHHFLLQRALSKKGGNEPSEGDVSLLSVCSEIFRVVLHIVNHKDIFRDFQVDFVQILVKHGIPAAAVLAVELLRQEEPHTSTSTTIFPLHRSDTIQNLSVLASCLGTVRQEANGYQSCDRGRRFIKKILDMILGAGPAVTKSSPLSQDIFDPTLGAALPDLGSDSDFTQWLENMEFEQESWVNFS